jgi:hypothetical protein
MEVNRKDWNGERAPATRQAKKKGRPEPNNKLLHQSTHQ